MARYLDFLQFYSLYLLPFSYIIHRFNAVPYCCYTNDAQLLDSFIPENHNNLVSLQRYLAAIKD